MKNNKNKTSYEHVKTILKEIDFVLSQVDDYHVSLLIEEICKAKTIVLCGAGRVGMAAKGFAMRLGHLGIKAYMLGDATVPALKKGDLLIACSGSGETQTIYDLVIKSKESKARVVLVSSYIEHNKSRMAKIADTVVVINAPSKTKNIEGFSSIQPMTTLNEQCFSVFFDSVTLMLMERLNETHETMLERHSNLE